MRNWLGRLGAVVWLTLAGTGTVMAEAHQDKFSLIRSDAERTTFEFAESNLDFASVTPTDFVWNPASEVPRELIPAALFSDFQERFIGYDPLNRDRFEMRVYSGRLFPDRVALASDYARLMGRVWSKKSFGTMAHNRDFGEVLGGDDASGIMIINRISVMRRGAEFLVIRSKFHADHFETYAPAMATFIGSVQFSDPLEVDEVAAAMTVATQPVSEGYTPVTYQLPGNWQPLDMVQPGEGDGNYQLWFDSADPNRNGGLLLATFPPQSAVPEGEKVVPDPQAMANLAGAFANVALGNLLPGQDYKLEPVSKNSFDNLDPVTAFNCLFVFRAGIGEAGTPVKVSVMLTMGPKGAVIASATLSPGPVDLYLTGTSMHVSFVQGQALAALRAYWGATEGQSE